MVSANKQRHKSRYRKHLFTILILSMIAVPLVVYSVPCAQAAVSMTPASTTTIAGMYVMFSVTGLTADTAYDVIRSPDGGTTNTTVHDDILADGSGDLSFRVTIPDEGQYVIYLVGTGGSGIEDQSTAEGIDIIAMILPILMISIALGLFTGLAAKLKNMF